MPLDEINWDFLNKLILAKQKSEVTNATVNRILVLIRAILRKASLVWECLDKTPKILLLLEPTRRVRWINRQEAERIIQELPNHLKMLV